MRAISAAILAKQTTATAVPYVKFKLTSSEWLRNLTGIATGAPISLVNGANTVTVTTVGTFTVSIPSGVTGTVASGTCAVTGSPVTLVTGNNTITTSGAVGTITVTLTEVTYDYTTRVLDLEHHEEPYNDYATVVLRNNDRGVADDLTGYWVQIAYGYITGNNVADVEGAESAGNGATAEYSYTPRIWVKGQQELSSPGVLKVILQLDGMWVKLKEQHWMDITLDPLTTPPGFYNLVYGAVTREAILTAVLGKAGFTLNALGDQSDSIIDAAAGGQGFSVNDAYASDSFDYYDYIVYRIISGTKGYLRARSGLAFKFIYPQTSDAVLRTFYSNQQPYFLEYMERKKLLIPNHIYVLWGYDKDAKTWACTATTLGEASDATQIAKYGDVSIIIRAEDLPSQALANTRATVLLARAKQELLGGHLILPRHDCSLELYDNVQVQDKRGL